MSNLLIEHNGAWKWALIGEISGIQIYVDRLECFRDIPHPCMDRV